jgi:hypothetical protein
MKAKKICDIMLCSLLSKIWKPNPDVSVQSLKLSCFYLTMKNCWQDEQNRMHAILKNGCLSQHDVE